MADWIASHVTNPLIIGPDMESEQWVKSVASQANAPHVILSKTRHGDRDVKIVLPDLQRFAGKTPVLIDDIISTGATMIKTIELLRQNHFREVVCLATHGLFADGAYDHLQKLGDIQIITANTIPHASNGLTVTTLLAE